MLDEGKFAPGINSVDDVVQRVVPHCCELLEVLDAHVNVEWAHSVAIIRYLYKYLYKNDTTAKIAVSELQSVDHIQEYLNAQRVSAVEAAWHLLNFDINLRSIAVETCQVHVPDHHWVQLPPNHVLEDTAQFEHYVESLRMSMQEKYLNRPTSSTVARSQNHIHLCQPQRFLTAVTTSVCTVVSVHVSCHFLVEYTSQFFVKIICSVGSSRSGGARSDNGLSDIDIASCSVNNFQQYR
eukprot:COSAG01_NODE_15217_length_1360_cov_2.303727_2_plen_238_part_00